MRQVITEISLVSVIVPVYNVEKYLRCCVDSVLNQNFRNFELILVDDGSTDCSGVICDDYAVKDNRVHVIHQKNAGQGKARNVGMVQASGKYIIFLDSDDYWMPSTLEILYSEAERNQTQVLIFSGKRFWDGIVEPKNADPGIYLLNAQNNVVKTGPESLKTCLDHDEYYAEPGFRLYLRDYLISKKFLFDEGIIHEDVIFSFLTYLFAKRVECLGDRLYMHRMRPGSTMTNLSFPKSAHGHSVCLEKFLLLLDSHMLSKDEETLLERYCAIRVNMICSLYRKALKKNGLRAAKQVQKEVRFVLKKARVLPSLPKLLRLATYSLPLYFVLYCSIRIHEKLRQMIAAG